MPDIICVSGTNYGDCGKGLVANHFSTEKSLVVLCSNSCQRAHTVVHKGIRHVFRHFGSGTLKGAYTYLTDDFMINPAMFRDEYEKLKSIGFEPKVYYNPRCIIVSPYDMISNQLVETSRGDNRHSSCGCGAWETRLRTKDYKSFRERKDLTLADPEHFVSYTIPEIVRYYAASRFVDGSSCFKGMREFATDIARLNFESDVAFFLDHAIPITSMEHESEFFHSFDKVIFENSQGLLLDTMYNDDIDRTTPAHVGAYIPSQIIHRVFALDRNITVKNIYVTRTYFTRHGNGDIGTFGECSKASINAFMEDKTNVPNPWQGNLRYGLISKIDARLMLMRMMKDNAFLTDPVLGEIKSDLCLVITHINEYKNEQLLDVFNSNSSVKIYLSDNEEEVYELDQR